MGDAPLRVLFVSPSLGAGGAERHLVRLLNAMDRQSFDVTLALHRGGGAFEADLDEAIPKVVLRPGRPVSTFLRMLRAVHPLRRWIRTQRPQVVMAVQNHAAVSTLLACRTLSAEQRPRVVVGVQNNLNRKFEGWRLRPTSHLLLGLMRRLLPRADRVVAASEGVAKDLPKVIPGLDDTIEVIYNAGFDVAPMTSPPMTDPPKTKPLAPRQGNPNAPKIVACGRLIEQKGFDVLIDAMARLGALLPSSVEPSSVEPSSVEPSHLWIVGEGPCRGDLEAQVRRLKLDDRVWFAGFQPRPSAFMAQATVFAMPSRWEGFGNVLVEAMACGVPVVASDCPHGPREILDDGKVGCLVPVDDADALAQTIAEILNTPALAASLGAKAAKRAEAFSSPRAARQVEDLLLRLTRDDGGDL